MAKEGKEEQELETAEDQNDGEEETKTEETSKKEKRAVLTGPLPLDWTRVDQVQQGDDRSHDEGYHPVIRFPWEVTELNKEDDYICVVGTAGQKITRMGINLGEYCNPKLKQLIFRSNVIRKMEGIGAFEELEILELYDNMIEVLGALNEGANGAPGATLKVLDMSYNVIRDMQPVSLCPNLTELCKWNRFIICTDLLEY